MIVIGPDSAIGNMSTPLAISERLFSQGVIFQKGLIGRLSQSVTFVENGDINIAADAIASPRQVDVIGDYVARVAYIYENRGDKQKDLDEVMARVDKVLKKCNELYAQRFRIANGFDASGDKAKTIDVLMESVPMVGRSEFVMFFDRTTLVIETDQQFKAKQDDLLQEEITNQMQGIKCVPKIMQIGYGLLRDDWSKMTRPNTYMRVGPKTVLRSTRTRNQFIKSEWQVQSFYMYLLAEAMRRWLGEAIPAYTLSDWVALANILVGWISGYGDTNRDQIWDASDIEVSLNSVPGMGWTKANRFLFGNVQTEADFKMYWVVMNLLGFVSQRVKAASSEMKLKKVISSNDWMVTTRTKQALQPNIAGFGSVGTYYMLMPRNNFAFGEKIDVPMPCIVNDETFDDQVTLLKKANNYEDLLPYEQQSWSDVTIDRGEVPDGAIRTGTSEAQFIRLHATTDARIHEFQDTSSRFVRNLIQWRFPTEHIVDNGIDRIGRLRLFIWGLLANGEKGQKNAYVIESSLDIFKPEVINYRRGPLDTNLVDKKDTGTTGDQVIKPGTIPVTPNVQSRTELSTQVNPPPPVVKAPDPVKVVETKTGKEVDESDIVDESSDSNKETNNTVQEREQN